MNIDKKKVEDTFKKYTDNYDTSDEKIKLKVDHTYRVAALSERIAESLGLNKEDTDLAWLIGMLHDIGRFEQLKNYGTFSDADSIDHAHYGVKLLFDEGLIWKFIDEMDMDDLRNADNKFKNENICERYLDSGKYKENSKKDVAELDILKTAIWNHSAYRVEDGLSERVMMFCDIIRDADKIDILKVNYDVTLEVIYDVTTEELKNSKVTDEVMNAFMEHHAVLRSLKKTPIDNLIGHAALVFELVYSESFKIVREQGYLEKMLSYVSNNPETLKQFKIMHRDMDEFLEMQ